MLINDQPQPARHPHLRPRRPRAARQAVHADRLARPGGLLMAGLKISKGDRVRVLSGKDRGKEGEVMRALPREGKVIVDGVNVAKKQPAPDPDHQAGRDHRQGHADPGVQRRPGLPVVRQADPGRLHDRRRRARRSASARSAEVRSHERHATTERVAPRLKTRYDETLRAQLKDELGLGNVMQVPRLDKIVINMGVGAAIGQASLLEGAVRDLTDDHRPEAGGHPGQEVDRRLQAPRGQRHRRQGHPAGRPHVGVLRPADLPRHPPHPRLPGPQPPVVRRPRQLHVRRHRAADLPRDRLRQGSTAPWHGHHHRHDRPHRRRRARPCSLAFGFPFKREGQ